MKWTGRVVTDTRGDAGVIILSDKSTACDDLKDWLLDYYDIDVEEAECLSEHLCAPVLTDEARQYAMSLFGLSVGFAGEEIYERLAQEGEPVTKSRTTVSLGTASLALGDDHGEHGDEALAGAWWRCGDEGESWITDEVHVEIAAEYLYAAAHDEN